MNSDSVIFLDVDGVITSSQHSKEINDKTDIKRVSLETPIDWNCLEILDQLLSSTEADVVLTSAWRRYGEGLKKIRQLLSFYGHEDRLVNTTPYLLKDPRYVEILTYLNDSNYEHVVILDDIYVYDLDDHAVRTDRHIGLTQDNVDEAKRILKKKYYGPREVYYGRW